jgi:hypothetical protein
MRRPKDKRAAATEEAYDCFRRRVLSGWASMEDYIRATMFRWTIGLARGKRVALRLRLSGGRPIAFEPNPFPYAVGPAEAHWVLWAERPMSRPLIQKYLDTVLPTGIRSRFYVNHRTQQSVPGVWHAHVFLGGVTRG